jgi:hypothetical protein
VRGKLYLLIKFRHTAQVIIFVKLAIYLRWCGFLSTKGTGFPLSIMMNDRDEIFFRKSSYYDKVPIFKWRFSLIFAYTYAFVMAIRGFIIYLLNISVCFV